MELALAISTLEHKELAYVAQLGVQAVILGGTGITEQLQWDYLSLLNVKSRSPAIAGDTKGRAGMAYSIGYMRAMIDAVRRNM